MKKLLIAVGAVIVVLIVAVVAVPMFVSADAFKGQILSRVEDATGRQLRIAGPLTLGLFPTVRVEAAQVTLANPSGAASPAMAAVKQLDIAVRLIPLLSGRIEVERLVLVDPVIDLEIDANGRPSWSFAESGASLPAPAPGTVPPKNASMMGLAALSRLQVKEVSIENGDIRFLDRRDNQHYELQKVAVTLSAPRLDAPFTLDGSALWRGQKIALSARLDSTGAVLQPGGAARMTASVTSVPVTLKFAGRVANEAAGDKAALAFDGHVALSSPSLRDLVAWSGQEIALPKHGFGAVALTGAVHAETGRASFSNATFSLDAIKAAGSMTLDEAGGRPRLNGALQTGMLDLNPYLGPAAASGWSSDAFDTALLRQLDADLTLDAAGVKYRHLQIGKSAMALHLAGGKLTLDLHDAALYRGSAKGKVEVDATVRPPAVTLAGTVSNVDLAAFLRDSGGGAGIDGAGSFTLTGTAHGDSERALVATLDGKASFRIANGGLGGVDLGGMLKNSADSFHGGGTTAIRRASGSFAIHNGVMSNRDLAVSTASMDATGGGTVDLPARTLNYRIEPRLVAGIVTVPVIVSGPWDHIGYSPDVAGIAKGIVTAPVKVVGAGVGGVGRVGTGVTNGVGGALKNLFGN
jgi:AsmA protein